MFGALFVAGCNNQQKLNQVQTIKNQASLIPTITSLSLNCAKQGEVFNVSNPQGPQECCDGLKNVFNKDMIAIADKCYSTGTESGTPFGKCSDCGNGICENIESVCSCEKDCIGKGKSDYQTVKDFCDNGFHTYCDRFLEKNSSIPEIDLCKLCSK